MPGSDIHIQLTREALELSAVPLEKNCASELIREYCLYPDYYFGRQQELGKYQYFTDGIQFHYLPDTPWNDVYRYWGYDKDGKACKIRPFRNENFIHANNGFLFLITKCVEEWKKGCWDEGSRYLGTLLHTLEDSTFGPHTMEGPHGVDFFALNRLSGKDLVTPVCRMKPDQAPLKELEGEGVIRILGRNPEEVAMRLYAEYTCSNNASRQCCFREAVRHFTGTINEQETIKDCHAMRVHAVKVCAEVVKSCYALATGEGLETLPATCCLAELEPVEFPFNGAGPYHFRTMTRDGSTLKFGIQQVVALSYSIAENTFSRFETALSLEEYTHEKGVFCKVFLRDELVLDTELKPGQAVPLSLKNPGGMLSFRFRGPATVPGGIVLKDPCLFC